MSTEKPSRNIDSSRARTATILRGALAESSDRADDRYRRVILMPETTTGAADDGGTEAPPLRLDAAAPTGEDEALRDAYRAAVDGYRAQHQATPTRVVVGDGAIYHVTPAEAMESEPLRNKVALVTGAAGAIGAGICRGLLQKGCHVVAADLARDNLDALVAELEPAAPGRLAGVVMDVTDPASVARGFEEALCTWGGVDLVIVNAGIAMVAPLMELELEAFRRLEKVNVEGTLLTLAEAGRRMCLQGTGGDIVLISTKNVFAPGAQFGAYSATKAGSHQLARIASLEFAPHDIRVNMVAPDAVFSDGTRRSGLWAAVGPSRMRARGLDEKGLETYYQGRNLLKTRVTPEHVANAVLFFATRQTPTTGATIPVDGGLPDSTPR